MREWRERKDALERPIDSAGPYDPFFFPADSSSFLTRSAGGR
jgi:hypothetical protein